jgi:hypothetical protein
MTFADVHAVDYEPIRRKSSLTEKTPTNEGENAFHQVETFLQLFG